jgi:hypothetical protein
MGYPRVNRSHIVPKAYLSAFAEEGMIAMRLVGEAESRTISIKDAGVRTDYYSRTRPNTGERIDDIEWSLSVLESVAIPTLRQARDAWPPATPEKAKLAQLFGYQLVRGPRWREWYEKTTGKFVDEAVRDMPLPITETGVPPTTEEVEHFKQELLSSTTRSTRMLGAGLKVASALGSMHWMLIEFQSPMLATSDHPVVPWPLWEPSRQPVPTPPEMGLFETLEIRVPISPRLAIVMTWLDDEDRAEPVRGVKDIAANLNAFTVAQAEQQWFHIPTRVPPRACGQLLPLSPRLLPGYGTGAVEASRRRQSIQSKIQKRIGEKLEQEREIEIVTVTRNENVGS